MTIFRKNIFPVILSFAFLLFIPLFFVPSASAMEKDLDDLYKLDLDSLYQDAKNGISDIPLDSFEFDNKIELVSNNIMNKNLLGIGVPKSPKIETYSTAKILKTNENSELVAITTFHDVELDEKLDKIGDEVTTFAIGTQPDDTTDSTFSVRAYSTIFVESYTTNNISYKRLTKTTGGWTILDNSVTTSNRKVSYGTAGYPLSNGENNVPISGLTFSFDAAHSGVNIGYLYTIGVNSTVTLKRGSSTWTLFHQNNW